MRRIKQLFSVSHADDQRARHQATIPQADHVDVLAVAATRLATGKMDQ